MLRFQQKSFLITLLKRLSITCGLSLLTGCVNLQPIPAHTEAAYALERTAPPQSKAIFQRTNSTVLVTTPIAITSYSTSKMIYTQRPYQLRSFANNRWVAPPAQMLTPLLVQSLQNTNYFKAVLSTPYFGETNYRIDSELLKLEQNFSHKPSEIQLAMRVQVTNAATEKLLASRRFDVTVAAPSENPYGGVVAANEAVATLMQQINAFVIAAVSRG